MIEDIHWADPVVLEFLSGLTAVAGDCPAILVVTARTESDPLDRAWRTSTEGGPFMTIDLAPLRNVEATELARAMGTDDEDLATACADRSGGNPLFLEQLLRGAEELGQDAVPGTVRSLVLARMDGLDPIDKRAVQAAAVMGQRFTISSLRHLLDDPDYTCDRLFEEVFLKPDGGECMFAHALVRDAIYTSLLKSERSELHRRASEWFQGTDPSLRAEHLDRAEDPSAAAAYLVAARAEVERFHFSQVSRLAARGRELAAVGTERFELACIHGEALRKIGQIDDAVEAFRAAIKNAPPDAKGCRAWIGLAEALSIADRYQEALIELEAAQEVAEAAEDDGAVAEIRTLRGNIYFPLGRMDDCLAEHEAALSMARRVNSKLAEAKALSGLGDAFYQRGRMRTAQKYFNACVQLAHDNDFLQIEAVNLAMLGITYIYINDLDTARRYCTAGIELAQKIADLRAELIARLIMGDISWYAGDLAETSRQGELGVEISRRLGSLRFEGEVLAYLGRIAWKNGRRDEATELFDRGLRLSRDAGMHYAGPEVLAAIARFTEDGARRREALAEGSELLNTGACVSHCYFHFYQFAIEVMLEEKNWDGAIGYGQQLATYTEAEPLPWADFFIDRANALAAWGRGDRSADAANEIRRVQAVGNEAGITMTYPEVGAQ